MAGQPQGGADDAFRAYKAEFLGPSPAKQPSPIGALVPAAGPSGASAAEASPAAPASATYSPTAVKAAGDPMGQQASLHATTAGYPAVYPTAGYPASYPQASSSPTGYYGGGAPQLPPGYPAYAAPAGVPSGPGLMVAPGAGQAGASSLPIQLIL